MLRSLGPQANAEPRFERGQDAGDDALDALVGQRLGVVAQLEPERQAALAGGDAGAPGSSARRCRTGSRRGRRRPAAASIAAMQRLVGDVSSGDDGEVAPRRLLLRQRLEARHARGASAPRRRSRTRPACRAARRPGASADAARRRSRRAGRRSRSRRCGPDAAPDAAPARSSRRTGANSASRSPLTSKKSTARSASPHCSGSPGRRRARRAAAAGAGRPRRRRRPARSGRAGTPCRARTRARACLAREVDAQHLDQAADQARAHHRQRLAIGLSDAHRRRRCRRSRAPSARRRS